MGCIFGRDYERLMQENLNKLEEQRSLLETVDSEIACLKAEVSAMQSTDQGRIAHLNALNNRRTEILADMDRLAHESNAASMKRLHSIVDEHKERQQSILRETQDIRPEEVAQDLARMHAMASSRTTEGMYILDPNDLFKDTANEWAVTETDTARKKPEQVKKQGNPKKAKRLDLIPL